MYCIAEEGVIEYSRLLVSPKGGEELGCAGFKATLKIPDGRKVEVSHSEYVKPTSLLQLLCEWGHSCSNYRIARELRFQPRSENSEPQWPGQLGTSTSFIKLESVVSTGSLFWWKSVYVIFYRPKFS